MGFLQLFDEFYTDSEPTGAPAVGDIYWAPVPEVNEVPRILDVLRADPEEHSATSFEIVDIKREHFSQRDRLPIKRLNLGETEELIIAKGKKRPVLVLSRNVVPDITSLPRGSQRRMAQSVGRESYLVAPFYSVSLPPHRTTMFGPVLVARIRALRYVHLACLPARGKPGVPDSIVRLDRVFPCYLSRGCEKSGDRLADEPLEIIQAQLALLTGGTNTEPYNLAKELVADTLPEELA